MIVTLVSDFVVVSNRACGLFFSCSQNYEFECNGPAAVAGFPVGILIALIAAILIILSKCMNCN